MRTVTALALDKRQVEMTLEEWAALDEDIDGELVDGFLVEEEVGTPLHEGVLSWLMGAIRSIVPLGGRVYGSNLKFGVGPKRGRKPDLAIYLPGSRLPNNTVPLLRSPPSAMVEVISPGAANAKRDRIDKVQDYAKFGVRYYWLIDPQLRTLEILELSSRKKPTLILSASSGRITVPGSSSLRLDLDSLWAEIDGVPNDDLEPPSTQRSKRKRRA